MKLTADLPYPIPEQTKLAALETLFQDWQTSFAQCTNDLIRMQADEMVFDGFYPFYFCQPKRILFVGREARGIAGCNYLEVLYGAYREGKRIGNKHLNFDSFHSRMLYVAWGLIKGMPDWENIPWADDIGDSFGSDSGISFAFMNLSKVSNESDQWNSDWEMIGAAHDAATRSRNFIRDEVALLEPEIVITMNLEARLDSLGKREMIEHTPKVNTYWLDSSGHRSLMLDCYHFSAPGMNDVTGFYLPICEAVRNAQACADVQFPK